MARKNGEVLVATEAEVPLSEEELERQKQWILFVEHLHDFIRVFGSLFFMPVMCMIGIGFGLRAGIIVAFEKTLEMFKAWSEK